MAVVESLLANTALQQVVGDLVDFFCPMVRLTSDAFFVPYARLFLTLTVTSLRIPCEGGGTTYAFLRNGGMEKHLLGGWASSSSARVYLADAVATVRFLQLSHQQLD